MDAAPSRRRFLTALGLGAAATTRAGRALGQSAGIPKRLICVFTSSGTIKDRWRPAGSGNAFALGPTLSDILQPLSPMRSRMLVVDGLDMLNANDSPGGPHPIGVGGLFTGWELQQGDFHSGQGPSGWANGPSVDQVVARGLQGSSPYASLEFGVQVGRADNYGRISFRAAGQPNPPMEDPYEAFTRVFGSLGGTPAQQAANLARRRSVLDFASSDLATLGGALSGDDRHRLDAHASSIRDLETRLQTTMTSSDATCTTPAVGAMMDLRAPANLPAIGHLQMDLIAASLACGQTRVASLQFSRGLSQTTFPWLGISQGHHSLSHEPDSDSVSQNKLVDINNWYAKQLLYLCNKLDAIPERDGSTLLDHTLIVWGNELSKGNQHLHSDIPFVLLGGAGGALRMGRYANIAGDGSNAQSHCNLLLTIAHAMGVRVDTVGNPRHCSGVLASLQA